MAIENLVIVESPAKARTISRFLGKNFEVLASYGHLRDLPKSKLGIDVEKNFAPSYVIPSSARKRASELRKAALSARNIYIATDEDREGEAIGWHLIQMFGLPLEIAKRVTFHEIVPEAVREAMKNPRLIDLKLVDAQQARRVLDRLVGYKLSPFLWKKIARGLSAGRVQSVALRLVAEREREIERFEKKEYWEVEAKLAKEKGKDSFLAKLVAFQGKPVDLESEEKTKKIVSTLEKEIFEVGKFSEKKQYRYPPPPFSTSTLQQQAVNRLGFSVKKTMLIAQQLYEGVPLEGGKSEGLITYMRTDSLHLADGALRDIRRFIKDTLGSEYLTVSPRRFRSKSKGAQEAHEAIRPTSVFRTPEAVKSFLNADQFRLYNLIWQRAVASQMKEAEVLRREAEILAGKYLLKAAGLKLLFNGFTQIWPADIKESFLPELKAKEGLKLLKLLSSQHFTEPSPRYTEASLVKTLEEMGIGRPSTYSPTISTLIERGYVAKEKKALVPQEIGLLVSDFLVEHFPGVVDFKFTAHMEEDLDEIASGEKKWVPVVKAFYLPFAEHLSRKEEEMQGEKIGLKTSDKKCPLCRQPLIERFGRYGKFLACSNFPECKYTQALGGGKKIAPEKTGKKCPRCGGELVKRKGRFGEFIGCGNYPKCNYIEKNNNQTGVKCPKCGSELVEKRTKRGRTFYGCSNYPKCNFAVWDKPIQKSCPTCKGLMTLSKKKGWPVCQDCGYEEKSYLPPAGES